VNFNEFETLVEFYFLIFIILLLIVHRLSKISHSYFLNYVKLELFNYILHISNVVNYSAIFYLVAPWSYPIPNHLSNWSYLFHAHVYNAFFNLLLHTRHLKYGCCIHQSFIQNILKTIS
jgi:hypothetical protein